jgi:hypothetical protein
MSPSSDTVPILPSGFHPHLQGLFCFLGTIDHALHLTDPAYIPLAYPHQQFQNQLTIDYSTSFE